MKPSTDRPGSVSVVIPTYMNARYIRQALDSVLAQTRPANEIIVVNDGSTDETRDVLRPYFDRIRYVEQSNRGIAQARNRALELATGDYIKFVDADDWLPDNAIQRLATVLDRDPEVGLAYGRGAWRDEAGSPTSERWTIDYQVGKHRDTVRMLMGNWIPTPAAICRRTALEEVGRFPLYRMGSDWAMWLRLLLSGWSAFGLDEVTFYYRRHPGNITAAANQRRIYQVNLDMLADTRRLFDTRLTPAERAALRASERNLRCRLAWHEYSIDQRSNARRAFARNLLDGPDVDAVRGLILSTLPGAIAGRVGQLQWRRRVP